LSGLIDLCVGRESVRQLVWWEDGTRSGLVTETSALSSQHCVCAADHLSVSLRGERRPEPNKLQQQTKRYFRMRSFLCGYSLMVFANKAQWECRLFA